MSAKPAKGSADKAADTAPKGPLSKPNTPPAPSKADTAIGQVGSPTAPMVTLKDHLILQNNYDKAQRIIGKMKDQIGQVSAELSEAKVTIEDVVALVQQQNAELETLRAKLAPPGDGNEDKKEDAS